MQRTLEAVIVDHSFSIPLFVVIGLFTIVLVNTAWLSDDSYITFRTVDNFVNGYGLTWNVSERVETFTNPLWMFLVSLFYFFTNEIYYTSIILSITICVLTILIFAFKISKTVLGAILGIGIFIFSKPFIDYSTSGLENPLTHLILAVFLLVYIKSRNNFDFKTLFLLSIITALGGVNRLDTLVLFLPCLVFAFLKLPKIKGLYVVAFGLLPLIAWKGFTLFYYGFPFPNTAYSKVINPGIGKEDLIQQGFYYFENSLSWDPLTLSVIFSAFVIPFIIKQKHLIPVVIGIAFYLIFIIQIGGDFMSGRYFTAPLFMAVVLISQINFNSRLQFLILGIFSGVIITLGISADHPSIFSDESYQIPEQTLGKIHGVQHGISNERAYYYQDTGLFAVLENSGMLQHEWASDGLEFKEKDSNTTIMLMNGMFSYYAGPTSHIIDMWGLGDPLLSRLPLTERDDVWEGGWRIGHFYRTIPPGYFKTIQSGENMIEDKCLARYYDKLSIMTRGNLFDPNRIQEIWNMNTGKYDYLLDSYIHRKGECILK